MEVGGFGSIVATGPSGSSDLPVHGFKFGKKIYFEDVGCPQTSSSSSSGTKKGKGVGQEQPSPRCQVEGCGEDLSGEKAYYCRHKVCIVHSKSPKVVVAGLEQRFCQQCSRFHQLSEFDQGKRSCRRRLAGHNERRRKPPPPMSLISHYGHYSSSFHDHNGRCASLLVDFTQPGSHETASHTRHMPRSRENLTFAQCLKSRDSATAPGRVINTTQYHPYVHRSAPAGMLFSNRHIPPPRDECLELSHSSCALSLLSNQQPWGTCQLSVGAPVMPSIHCEGNPVPQPAIPASFLGNRWGFKGQEACGEDAREVFFPINIAPQGTEAVTNPLQLPDELELALQGSKQCVNQRGNGREYLQPGNQMHWSL